MQRNGNMANFQAWGRLNDEGWVEMGEAAMIRWSKVLALAGPMAVQFLNALLHQLALLWT